MAGVIWNFVKNGEVIAYEVENVYDLKDKFGSADLMPLSQDGEHKGRKCGFGSLVHTTSSAAATAASVKQTTA